MTPQTNASKKNAEKRETRTLISQEIFQGAREVLIRHLDQQYRLQITKAGKLILNK